jgi:ribosomal protein S7
MNKQFIPHTIINRCFKGCLVKRGCGQRAHLIFDDMLAVLRIRLKTNKPFEVLVDMLVDLKPSVSLWKKKHGGTTFQLPYLITEKKGLEIAIHWLIKEAFDKTDRRDMAESLAQQVVDYIAGRNPVLKRKKEEIHKIALSSRAFLHNK